MYFIESFGHTDLTGLLLKWDSLTVSDDYALSFVDITHASSGGSGIQIEGTSVTLKKTLAEAISPAVIAFRLALGGKLTLSFLFDSLVLGKIIIEGGMAFIYDTAGTETDIFLSSVASTSSFWEVKLVPGLSGSLAIYRDGGLEKAVSAKFLNVGNVVNGFSLKLEGILSSDLSDFFVTDKLLGIKAVKCFFPSADVAVEMAPSAGSDHYTLLNNTTQDADTYVVSGYGQKEILSYDLSGEGMFSVSAIALTAFVGKDVGGDAAGLGIQGVEQVAGTDYTFGLVYPTSDVSFRQLITETQPSTGGSLTPDGIESLSAGVKVASS